MIVSDVKEETLTISQMSKKYAVTARALRFYESKELLFPKKKGQRRFFTWRDRARLKLILQGKRFGFALEEIRQLLNLYDIGDQQTTQLSKTYELGAARLITMEYQRVELELAIKDLKNMLKIGSEMLKEKGVSLTT